jgi:predicted GIY-YIG superfamily endonuclease
MHYLYKILCITNQKNYIGQTVDTSKRWYQHKAEARKDKPAMIINQAMKKYGINNFIFEIIVTCITQDQANNLETELVKQYESHISTGKGYNVSNGGSNAPKTEEWKAAIRKTWATHTKEEQEIISKKMSQSAKQRIIDHPNTNPATLGFTGADLTEESRKKISEKKSGKPGANKGKIFSKEWRNNISKNHASKKENFISPNKGKPMSEKQKQQISDTLSGKCKFSKEQIQQMKDLRSQRISQEKIAKIMKCNWKSVAKWAKI